MATIFRGGYFGTSTVGERGQIVIPAKAREEYGISNGDKLLVFGRPHHAGLLIIKAEDVTRYVNEALAELSGLGKILEAPEEGGEAPGETTSNAANPPVSRRRGNKRP